MCHHHMLLTPCRKPTFETSFSQLFCHPIVSHPRKHACRRLPRFPTRAPQIVNAAHHPHRLITFHNGLATTPSPPSVLASGCGTSTFSTAARQGHVYIATHTHVAAPTTRPVEAPQHTRVGRSQAQPNAPSHHPAWLDSVAWSAPTCPAFLVRHTPFPREQARLLRAHVWRLFHHVAHARVPSGCPPGSRHPPAPQTAASEELATDASLVRLIGACLVAAGVDVGRNTWERLLEACLLARPGHPRGHGAHLFQPTPTYGMAKGELAAEVQVAWGYCRGRSKGKRHGRLQRRSNLPGQPTPLDLARGKMATWPHGLVHNTR